jgi:hypothetical protein
MGAKLNTMIAVLSMIQGVASAFLANTAEALSMIVGVAFAVAILVRWFDQQRGGVDNHCLYGSLLFLETLCFTLILAAAS